MCRAVRLFVALVLVVVVSSSPVLAQVRPLPQDAAGAAFFEKRIRPILAANCYACHGPEKKRSGLKLDSLPAILRGGDRGPAVMPGKPDESLLIRAVHYGDEPRMPPKGRLSDAQINDLVAWVKMGAPGPNAPGSGGPVSAEFNLAERQKHWAYQPVQAVAVPTVHISAWCRSPIDFFILDRLEKAGLSPAPPADRRALIRRVTFDLIGLPPTPAEVDAFLADSSPQAVDKVVERLLASPHYGERWARHWLDLVGYSQTLGFEFDYDLFNAWRYRDYVIRALNRDLPYDTFVIEHLAGDLVPRPRHHEDGFNESILATGFFWMGEAKQTPIDIRQEQADVIDNQIDVLSKAFLAQTIACARCHDHKFDAVSTRDYYALAGYLKSSRYQQAFIDSPERITAKAKQMAGLRSRIRELARSGWTDQALEQLTRSAAYLLAAWKTKAAEAAGGANLEETARERRLDLQQLQRWRKALADEETKSPRHPLHAWATLADQVSTETDPFLKRRQELTAALREERARADRGAAAAECFEDFRRGTYDGWFVSGDAFGPKPAVSGDVVLGDQPERPIAQFVTGGAHSGLLSRRLQGELRSRTFTIDKSFIHFRLAGRATRVNLVIDGYTLIMNPMYGKLTLALPLQTVDKAETHDQLAWGTMPVERWLGHRAFIEVVDSTLPMHRLNPPPSTGQPPGGVKDGYIVLDKVVFSDDPNPPTAAPNRGNEAALERAAADNLEGLAKAYQDLMVEELRRWQEGTAVKGGEEDGANLLNWLLRHGVLDGLSPQAEALAEILKEYRRLESALPQPRRAPALADGTGEDECVFLRGNYKTLGQRVQRRPPEAVCHKSLALSEIDAGDRGIDKSGSGRLELARRLVDPSNPLIARVLVNRLWQHHFGAGIVRTPDDFGRMGQEPTHPELLDYLAMEFVRSGWSIKHVHRLMVLSSTYQQSSAPNQAHARVDPENRLWRGVPVRRLEAEAIRDAILAVSGRLDPTMYGPGVLPYLTSHMEGRGRPVSGPLDGDGRRSIYVSVRRNFLTPMLVAFDYPAAFGTVGRRVLSSTPAQALSLLNDPFVVEQAARWARRALDQPGQTAEERISALYKTAFARPPEPAEMESALHFLERQASRHHVGSNNPAAWADLCHVLINVKEFVFLD
jgi:cytochrome c553